MTATIYSIVICLSLLFATTLVDARSRAHSKRRIPSGQLPFDSHASSNNNNNMNSRLMNDQNQNHSDQSRPRQFKEVNQAQPEVPAVPSVTGSSNKHQANQEQVELFTRLLFERLNIREPPNVTANVNEAIGFPSSIVKQLEQQVREQQYKHHKEEDSYYRQQKLHDEVAPTAERAILPGDQISHNTCARKLAAKLNLNRAQVDNIDCFRFTKSPKDAHGLPSNQIINELRIFLRRNYFHWIDHYDRLTPEMFQIYQVFRPTSNDTSSPPPMHLSDTSRLAISQVKELSDSWLELIFDSNQRNIDLQQLYKQLIMPLYGLAIDRDLSPLASSSSFSSSSMEKSFGSSNGHYHRLYHSKKHLSSSSQADADDQVEGEANDDQQLPYMLVEYGAKVASSSSGNRGTRSATARPARGCHPNSPCCRRPLTIDLDQGSNALNFVIYPRQLDIGECVGICGTSGSSLKHTDVKNAQYKNEQHSAYNMFLLQNSLYFNRSTTTTQVNRPEQHTNQCCSYSRTGGLELMYTTTSGGPIIRKFIPNMVVEECKCGLPATIQQV